MKLPLLQLKCIIVTYVGNVAHKLKTYNILLIVIIATTKGLTHSLLTKEKCTITIGNAEMFCKKILRTVYSKNHKYCPHHISSHNVSHDPIGIPESNLSHFGSKRMV